MLRFALGAAGRAGLGSERWLLGAGGAACFRAAAESASSGEGGAGGGVTATAARVSAGGGCSAALGRPSLTATDTKPSKSPAAAAATIVQREPIGRAARGAVDGSSELVTNGASLSGARLEGAMLGGGSDSSAGGAKVGGSGGSAVTAGAGGVGVGIARNVIFSLADGTGSLTGGGGGKLERRSGMCSDSGASPPRTTTAWRGGDFKPGRAMNPPRGVMASADTGADSKESSSGG
ncbi:MAG: hypothetical protein ABUL60_01380 [Myxococcales bacterium]